MILIVFLDLVSSLFQHLLCRSVTFFSHEQNVREFTGLCLLLLGCFGVFFFGAMHMNAVIFLKARLKLQDGCSVAAWSIGLESYVKGNRPVVNEAGLGSIFWVSTVYSLVYFVVHSFHLVSLFESP